MTAQLTMTRDRARQIWMRAQRLDGSDAFGSGPAATQAAVAHLGYVQIDTINVIERCHHHILFSRIPGYRRADLVQAQAVDKSVFEYWTHALAYVPSADFRFHLPAMRQFRVRPPAGWGGIDRRAYAALLRRIRAEGALSIRDIDDEERVEKDHPWASRKPSKRLLEYGFYLGDLTISARAGMVKTYDLTDRHFGWSSRPRAAGEAQVASYLLARALRAQGVVSLDSICYGTAGQRRRVAGLIEAAVRRKQMLPVRIAGAEKLAHWTTPEALATAPAEADETLVHILSPFDPLVIQRQRLKLLFDYEHRFEAYVPAARRVLGYFALPVLVGDRVVAALDLKTDRQAGKLLVQNWVWFAAPTTALKTAIEDALHSFEAFQLG